MTINRIDLAAGRFTATLASGRAIVSFTPRMTVTAPVQYNSAANLFTPTSAPTVMYDPPCHPAPRDATA